MCLTLPGMTRSAAAGEDSDRVDFAFAQRVTSWMARFHADRPLVLVALVWAVTWVPLVALSAAEGRALGDLVEVPFLRDVAANVRVLVALPLLLLGASFADARLSEGQAAFEQSGLVDDACRSRFRHVLRSSAALVHSPRAEVAAVVLAAVSGVLLPSPVLGRADSWQAIGAGAHAPLTLAGFWLVTIVLPLYRYLLLRWALRFFVWSAALVRIARLDLPLLPTHADRSAGLGFLGRAQKAFAPLFLALSVVFAAALGNDVLHLGLGVEGLKRPIALFTVVALALWIAPLLVFLPRLVRLKRRSLLEHDAFAARCSRAFDAEWLRTEGRDVRTMLAGDEVQSLASLKDVCDTVRRLKPVPLDGADLAAYVLVVLLPVLPLVLTTVPPADLGRLLRTIVA